RVQREAAGPAGEEAPPERGLEVLNGPGDSGMREPERLCSGGEAAQLRHRHERSYQVPVEVTAVFCWHRPSPPGCCSGGTRHRSENRILRYVHSQLARRLLPLVTPEATP